MKAADPGPASTTTAQPNSTQDPPDPGLGAPLKPAADPIDRVVRLAPKWTIFVLAACGFLVAGAAVWAFAGEITSTVDAPGLLKDNGYMGLSPASAGEVTSVNVSSGEAVSTGDVLVELGTGDPILAPQDSVIAAVYVAVGDKISSGSVAVAITDPNSPDIVYALLPSSSVGTMLAGLPVQMDVSSAPATTYGYMLGTVLEVSSLPLTTREIAKTLGVPVEIVVQGLGDSPGLLAKIGITPDLQAPSRYAWTLGTGPEYLIGQGTQVTAKIIMSQQAPIQMVFPGATGGSQ